MVEEEKLNSNCTSSLQREKTRFEDKKKKQKEKKERIQLLEKTSMAEEQQELTKECDVEEENPISSDGSDENEELPELISEKELITKNRKKERLLKETAKAENRGVCYLSRIPPQMDHVKLRHLLTQYGQIQRIYLAPEDPTIQAHRKRAGGFRGKVFSEGWVEFTKKGVAKRVANILNGEQIGGRRKSSFYYDIWNIKYLTKFKWDDLTDELAYKNAIREQKLPIVLSAAKRERDFYLSRVDKSRALSAIDERVKKKQKVQQEAGTDVTIPDRQPKVVRQFRQTKPVGDNASQNKPKLSKDILAGIFGGL